MHPVPRNNALNPWQRTRGLCIAESRSPPSTPCPRCIGTPCKTRPHHSRHQRPHCCKSSLCNTSCYSALFSRGSHQGTSRCRTWPTWHSKCYTLCWCSSRRRTKYCQHVACCRSRGGICTRCTLYLACNTPSRQTPYSAWMHKAGATSGVRARCQDRTSWYGTSQPRHSRCLGHGLCIGNRGSATPSQHLSGHIHSGI